LTAQAPLVVYETADVHCASTVFRWVAMEVMVSGGNKCIAVCVLFTLFTPVDIVVPPLTAY
jgi:hypothetical protein